ncbi:hypothetical protein [Lysinibacillus sp. 54212]|uniref:hypothetical protein n=1 Tax=Lysinibacillus sp. 54212 TaxID=3119829 RepID=UPI002FCB0320
MEVFNAENTPIMDVNGDGRDEILFNDPFGTLVKIEDDRMQTALLKNAFSKQDWVTPLVSIHYEGKVPTVTYSDSKEELKKQYRFTTTDKLELIR